MRRDSFFSRIQSWFSGSFHGRYLAYILAEIGKHHPTLIRELICSGCKIGKRALADPHFVPEFAFEGRVGMRRADLAVFGCDGDDEPLVLIEIKYRDQLIPESDIKPAQLDDYMHWRASGKGRHLLILSREMLRTPGVPALTWTQAARLLRRYASDSDLAKALIEHLEEEGIVMQNIDTKALIGFLKKLLCSPIGAGNQVGNLEGPQEFGRLLRNVKLLSTRFNSDFKAAWKAAGTKYDAADDPVGTKDASIDFDVDNRINEEKLGRRQSYDGSLDARVRNGGTVSVYARHSLGSGKGWLRVGYGFRFDVDKTNGHEKPRLPKAYVYAWAANNEFANGDIYSNSKLSSFELIGSKAEDSVDKVEVLASKRLLEVLEELMSISETLKPKQKMAIKLLVKSVGAKLKA